MWTHSKDDATWEFGARHTKEKNRKKGGVADGDKNTFILHEWSIYLILNTIVGMHSGAHGNLKSHIQGTALVQVPNSYNDKF